MLVAWEYPFMASVGIALDEPFDRVAKLTIEKIV